MSDQAFFVEPLAGRHDRKSFDCGEPTLNNYLHRFARQNRTNGSAVTYVATTPDSNRICAYFTLSAGAIALSNFPEEVRAGLPRLVPSVHLGRFAVDREFQGQQLGRAMLGAVFQNSQAASDIVGIAVIEVWALNETAHLFYQKFEFQPMLDDKFHQYIWLNTLSDNS